MPITAATHATEKSTFVITVNFSDENGDPTTINSGGVWHLTDRDGNIINSKEDQAIAVGQSADIVLTGDDLALPDPTDNLRIVTIEATYDGTLGNDLPLRDAVRFYIDNLLKIT